MGIFAYRVETHWETRVVILFGKPKRSGLASHRKPPPRPYSYNDSRERQRKQTGAQKQPVPMEKPKATANATSPLRAPPLDTTMEGTDDDSSFFARDRRCYSIKHSIVSDIFKTKFGGSDQKGLTAFRHLHS